MADFWNGGETPAAPGEDPEKKNFWQNENTTGPQNNAFWGTADMAPAEPPPTLVQAQHKAIWPSVKEVLHEAMVGAAMTGDRIGQAMGAILPETGIKEYYDKQLAAWENMPAQSVGGQMVRDIARFTSADVPTQMLLGPVGMGSAIGRIILGPTVSDLVAFSGDEKRLSNTLASLSSPEAHNSIYDYLAANPKDGMVEAKFKQAMEGVLMNAAIAPVAHLIGAAYRGAKGIANKMEGQAVGNMVNVVPDTTQVVGDADAVANQMLDMWHSTAKVNGKTVPLRDKIADIFSGVDRTTINPAYVAAGGPQSSEASFAAEYYKRLRSVPGIDAFTATDLAAKRDQFMGRLLNNEKPTKRTPGQVILDALDNNQKALDEARKETWPQFADRMKRAFIVSNVDSAGNLKKHLLETSGEEGRRAVDLYNLNRGASIKGQVYSQNAIQSVYQDINQADIPELAKIIQMRRDASIKVRDPLYSLPQDFGPGVKGSKIKAEDIAAAQRLHRTSLGADRYDLLNQRADVFFARVRDNVDVLEASGVIDLETATKLKTFDHAPMEFIDKYVDPIYHMDLPGHGQTTVRGSGIPFLANGDSKRLVENDPKYFLEQLTTRAHSRAMRNESAVAMLEVAKKGDSELVRLEVPKNEKNDWSQLTAMVQGKPETFYIRKDYVNEWQTNPHGLSQTERQLSFWTGNNLYKSLKTGANPAALIKLFPRDVMFAWLSADGGKLYSSNPVKYLNELSQDLGTVKGDAWSRTGRFKDFIDEGGGMYLMTHQGQVYKPDVTNEATTVVGKAWKKFEHIAGYLNETQEIAMRLAVREKAMRELSGGGPITPDIQKQATAIARDYMDYSQGGLLSKKIDSLVPYYNANVQGIRGVLRAANNNPSLVSQKLAWIMSGFAGLWLMNHATVGQEQTNISSYDRANNFTFMLPTYTTDEQGNKRYYYAKLAIDQSMAPFKALMDGILDWSVYGKDMTDEAKNIAGSIAQNLPNPTSIPLIDAIMRANGYDPFLNRPVWQGDKNLPAGQQFTDKTPMMARDVGEMLNLSPEAMSQAVGTWTGNNFFAESFGLIYDAAHGDPAGHGMDNQHLEGFIQTVPGLRQMLGKTHPLNGIDQEMAAMMEPAAMAHKQAMDAFDNVLNKQIRGGDLGTPLSSNQIKQATDWIKSNGNQMPEYVPAMLDRLKMTVTIDKVFKQNTSPSKLTRPPAFWLKLAGETPDVRADLFLDEMSRLQDIRANASDPKEKAAAEAALRETKQIVAGLGGYDPKTSMQFTFRLGRMAQERGVKIQ